MFRCQGKDIQHDTWVPIDICDRMRRFLRRRVALTSEDPQVVLGIRARAHPCCILTLEGVIIRISLSIISIILTITLSLLY